MSEQSDWIAEQEKLKLSSEIELALIKLTGKNVSLMSQKMGGNISFNEHLTIQRTLQTAQAMIKDNKLTVEHINDLSVRPVQVAIVGKRSSND